MNICIATIISPNYLAYARVLAESVARFAPDAAFHVLFVGRPDPAVQDALREFGLKGTFATELGLSDFDHLAFKYDLLELNTALKPTFLKSLFERGFDSVVYLDPDICLYQPPGPIMQALKRAEIVLIPHARAPVMDGSRPSDIDFLRAGTFNLGFVGLRRGGNALALLDWWERRCLSHGFSDMGFGTFADQKWLDLAPCYFESVEVLKHPGCNAAYWNLHERKLGVEAGRYTVNGEPLVFFHFSGVDALTPDKLSRHQNRHSIAPGSALEELVRDYCGRLLRANHLEWIGLPYGFATLDDGTVITPAMRRAATVLSLDTAHPFNSQSAFQRAVRRARLTGRSGEDPAKTTTLNFDPKDRRVTFVNGLLRLGARVIGIDRLLALLRYATFLGWQGNLAAVLLDKPFDLEHRDRRA